MNQDIHKDLNVNIAEIDFDGTIAILAYSASPLGF